MGFAGYIKRRHQGTRRMQYAPYVFHLSKTACKHFYTLQRDFPGLFIAGFYMVNLRVLSLTHIRGKRLPAWADKSVPNHHKLDHVILAIIQPVLPGIPYRAFNHNDE